MQLAVNHEYHIVELASHIPIEVIDWLEANLGAANRGRWFARSDKIYFYNEKDHMMFLLRWAGE